MILVSLYPDKYQKLGELFARLKACDGTLTSQLGDIHQTTSANLAQLNQQLQAATPGLTSDANPYTHASQRSSRRSPYAPAPTPPRIDAIAYADTSMSGPDAPPSIQQQLRTVRSTAVQGQRDHWTQPTSRQCARCRQRAPEPTEETIGNDPVLLYKHKRVMIQGVSHHMPGETDSNTQEAMVRNW
jgi:hypothetical protein